MKQSKILRPTRNEYGRMVYEATDAPQTMPEPIARHVVRTNPEIPEFERPSDLTRRMIAEREGCCGGDMAARATNRRRLEQLRILLAEQEYRERQEDAELARVERGREALDKVSAILDDLPEDLQGELLWARSEFENGHVSAEHLDAVVTSVGHQAQSRVIDEEVSDIHGLAAQQDELLARIEESARRREKRRAVFEKIGMIVGYAELDAYNDDGTPKD